MDPREHEIFDNIRHGDTVVMLVPSGVGRNGVEYKPKSGRAVLYNVQADTWTLNMGGKYGTPGVCTRDNFVFIRTR
jgi:hypothetical protein